MLFIAYKRCCNLIELLKFVVRFVFCQEVWSTGCHLKPGRGLKKSRLWPKIPTTRGRSEPLLGEVAEDLRMGSVSDRMNDQ